jgi:small subunit ribosomal protein S4
MRTLSLPAKKSRREGIQLSERTAHAKALARRPYPPGVHGPTSRNRLTDYGKQLREKQKAKRIYGLSERQFRNLFREAVAKRGNSSETLVQFLELRLDNVAFRAGFAKTRAAARQAVSHAQFEINGKKVNIPSYRVRPGEMIAVRQIKRAKGLWKNLEETMRKKKDVPSWLAVESKDMTVKVAALPAGAELQGPFDSKLIVEFYSRQ